MFISVKYTGLLSTLIFIISAVPAQAQWSFNPNLVSDVMSPVNLNPCTGDACSENSESYSLDSLNGKVNNSTQISTASLSFQTSKERRKQNLEQFVEKTRAVDPKGAADMAKLFASTDIIGEIGKGIAPYGLRTDNIADAYAVYWMTAWQAAHGDTSDFTRRQTDAVKNQSANALLSTPEFVNATDAIKQEMAEAYLLQAALIQASVDVAQTDRTIAKGLPSAVRQGAKASGLDLDAMTLTNEGFVPARKGSDASDAVPPVPGAAGEALADAGTADSENETATYALIAAAGAGTLAAVFGLGKMMGRRG